MKKKGLREATIKNTRKALSSLSKHSCLVCPEEVKGFIAGLERNESYKRNLSIAYNNHAKVHNISCARFRICGKVIAEPN
jgi:hypothetical protein